MKPIDAEAIKEIFPNRKSLNKVMDNAEILTASSIIEWVREEMCEHYCKMPYQYSVSEWEEMIEYPLDYPESPCNNCPLNML